MNSIILLNGFSLLCGVALFLYGMQQGEANIQKLGKTRLRQLIAGLTSHRISGYITGFLTTIVTQSSSATTVMVVGLASVQLMTLRQSLGVILGSDLGTTVTVGLFAIKFATLSPLIIAIGFFLTLATRTHFAGKLVLAIGFVFYGMHLMASATSSLSSLDSVHAALALSLGNPLIGLAAGAILTAVIQSSAATLALLIALAGAAGATSVGSLLPIVLGANVGTCATALLAMLQAQPEGIRVAWAHLAFKVVGALFVLPLIWLLPEIAAPWPVGITVAALHISFNLVISAIFLPLVPLVDRLLMRLVKAQAPEAKRYHVEFLHDKVLSMPTVALSQASREIVRMGDIVVTMLEESRVLIERYHPTRKATIIGRDNEVDFLHERIMVFLSHVSPSELAEDQTLHTSQLITITADIEHLGDICSKSIVTLAEKIDLSPTPLSIEGKKEIISFLDETTALFRETLAVFAAGDAPHARAIFARKHVVREKFSVLTDSHLARLYKHKVESLQTTSIHIDLLEEIQRINHFTFRIAEKISKEEV